MIPLESILKMFADGVTSLPLIAQTVPLQQATQPDVSIDDIPLGSPLSPSNLQRAAGVASSEPRVFTFDVPQAREAEFKNITCYIMMLDVILQQVRVQQTHAHAGVAEETNERMFELLTSMLTEPWNGQHVCGREATVACDHCALTSQWFNLALQVVSRDVTLAFQASMCVNALLSAVDRSYSSSAQLYPPPFQRKTCRLWTT